jgi:hypothetical protein
MIRYIYNIYLGLCFEDGEGSDRRSGGDGAALRRINGK